MIGAAVYSQLKNNAAVKALCKWVYPHVIPQGRDAPALTYAIDDDQRQQQQSGEGAYRQALVSVDCYTNKYADSHALADAVESALIDYRGQLGAAVNGIDADHIRLERRFDIFETQSKLYRVSLQFTIGYE